MANRPKIDNKTYESSKRYLIEAMKQMAEAGHRIQDLSDFVLEKFGDEFLPYLERFYRDIREGNVRLSGIKQSVITSFLGPGITAGERERERERMIRETAYLRAEQRGFGAGSPDDDWLYAERQIDEQLARHIGLVAKGRKKASSVTEAAEKELASVKNAVESWLESRRKTSPEATAAKKKPVKKAAAAAPAKAAGKEAASAKKVSIRKKTTTTKPAAKA
jgi:hypothetical protein